MEIACWRALRRTEKDGYGENSYAVSPKFGVIYSPMSNGNIYVNYSKALHHKAR